MSRAARTLRALPTLLRIGVAETIAYRAEFLVWILTTTIPLVMLGLWSSVASEEAFRGYGQDDFVAYYLATLIVRNLAGTWVAWQISEEIRLGSMAMRLLRPIHPFVAFAASHVAAIPFRSLVVFPVAVVLLLSSGANALTREPLQLALIVPSLAIAWLINFSILFALGTVSFWITKMMGILNLYFGLFMLLSGYLLPLPLLPSYIRGVAEWLPFRFMQSVPVELMTRAMSQREALLLVGGQLAWAAGTLALALFVWDRGVKRFESVGG
ncbi:MAG: ABC-2 family transporter protein [Deltaproteobacteria bacterium]|nr:ABC-2 family transporter protein [Deltaproteobacteria bacterium]MCW5803964.1 ABC-2 family transporter protein [Deltaproteobacteria bacterium]